MTKSPIRMCFIIYCLIKVVILEYSNSRAYRTWRLHVFCFYYSIQGNQLHTTITVCLFIIMKLILSQLMWSLIYFSMGTFLMQHVSLAFQQVRRTWNWQLTLIIILKIRRGGSKVMWEHSNKAASFLWHKFFILPGTKRVFHYFYMLF